MNKGGFEAFEAALDTVQVLVEGGESAVKVVGEGTDDGEEGGEQAADVRPGCSDLDHGCLARALSIFCREK